MEVPISLHCWQTDDVGKRIGAYVVGARATQKAFLIALLEPTQVLVKLEEAGQNFERLDMLEELKSMPFSAVWDYYCLQEGVPVGMDYIAECNSTKKRHWREGRHYPSSPNSKNRSIQRFIFSNGVSARSA